MLLYSTALKNRLLHPSKYPLLYSTYYLTGTIQGECKASNVANL